MKTSMLALLATAAVVVFATPMPVASGAGEPLADGLYVWETDEAGNTSVEFTPHADILNATAEGVWERSVLEPRGSGCHATRMVSSSTTDKANAGLLNSVVGTFITLGKKGKKSYVVGDAVSFLCSSGGASKPKSSIAGTWDWIKRVKCGVDHLGYGDVQEGTGGMVAGYTFNGDKFCGF
ncbi:hypothetical protein B0T22DRAFT_480253 [Podospora appendiculata]|uniref:Uncharacterized protein n=1 Tax=Podospora appendiculata TaxID=314037 RepID=A0AAE1CCX7_9PEZI|nr:hypothetical protein B0T22DRAFT_480253 [Podospora appendiculata]